MKKAALWTLLILSLIFKLFYLFKFSGYAHHLDADMADYWYRANARYEGDIFSAPQWIGPSPFFHLFVYQTFKLSALFGIFAKRLEAVLVLFAVLSTLSVWMVYKITEELTKNFRLSLFSAAFYACCYPILYFNTLLMSENVAIPLLIAATLLVLKWNESAREVFLAGILLALAAIIRPILGPLVFLFGLFILTCRSFSKKSVLRSFCFGLGFSAVIFWALVQNFYISKGQLKALAGYSAVGIFTQFCKPGMVYYQGGRMGNPAFFLGHPEYGVFRTDRPCNDTAYFMEMAKKCIQKNSGVWIDNLAALKEGIGKLYWPAFEMPGFFLWKPYILLTLFLILSAGLFYWVAPKNPDFLKKSSLLLAPIFCILLMSYFYTYEVRFLLPGLYGIYIVFFASLSSMIQNWKKSLGYYAGIVCFGAVLILPSGIQKNEWKKRFGLEKVRVFSLERASERTADLTAGNQWNFFIMPDVQTGILLKAKTPRKASRMEISTDSWDDYKLEFYLDQKRVGEMAVPAVFPKGGGIQKRILDLPQEMKEKPFNQILFRAVKGDGFYSLAYLILDPVS